MRALLVALALIGFAGPAFAQSTATPVVPGQLQSGICPPNVTTCFVPATPLSQFQTLSFTFAAVGSPGTLSATTTTSNLALPATGAIVEIANGGAVPVYVNLGVGSGLTATTSNMQIGAGQTIFLPVGAATYIAGITASSTASVTVTVGNPAAVSGGGSGGSVTITGPLGRSADASSVSTALSTEDVAAVSLPFAATTTPAAFTIATGGTFQSILASNANRKGCLIQNPISATETLFVFFGPNGSATTGTSVGLSPGSALSCAIGGKGVATDNISATATTTSHAGVVLSQ